MEQQQQLFKFRFSSKTSGSGLGLMVSKELMVSMGGDLEYFKPPTLRTGFRLLFKV
ncbi:MAG: ATP-binding protein [Bacteroidia bacterium]